MSNSSPRHGVLYFVCICVYGGLSASNWHQTMGQRDHVSVVTATGVSEGLVSAAGLGWWAGGQVCLGGKGWRDQKERLQVPATRVRAGARGPCVHGAAPGASVVVQVRV